MLVVALAGIAINLAATVILAGAERRSLNVEGAFQHVLTDLFAFIATAIAGAVVLATGFSQADGIAALVVAALMLRSGYGLLRDSGGSCSRRRRATSTRTRSAGCSPPRTTWSSARPARLGGHPRASPRSRRT